MKKTKKRKFANAKKLKNDATKMEMANKCYR